MVGIRILVTCALPYVNNVPHIGNIVGSHLPADIFARFCRLAGYETVFVGGSDEHGTPIEVAARKLGVSPKELCDRYYEIHKKIYEWFNISYDNFSRTSLPLHHETTQEFFLKMYENGYISEGYMTLPYCEKDDLVLPDRYVVGKCPKCGYESARGDQCENCSTLLNPEELIEPRCAICGSKPVFKKFKHLFFDLNKVQKELKEWIKSKEKIWPSQAVKQALGMIKEGLKPRCITRDLKWGVKVPLKGYEDKVFYVWFDAPIGYISSTKEWAIKNKKPEEWKKFWKDEEARIYHFIGKDNIPFHTIFWPGMLIANGEYSLPYMVAGLQYLNYEGDKISKSKEWGVFCEKLPEAGLDSDVWRFYLTYLIPETSDTEFKWREFQERVNNELVANLGNFVYRTLSFIERNFNSTIPEPVLMYDDAELLELPKKFAEEIKELMFKIRIRDSLKKVLELSSIGNKYFQDNEPWKDKERAKTVLYVCANLCYDIAILLSPFLPKSAEEIAKQLNMNLGKLRDVGKALVKPGRKINKPMPIFPKLTDDVIERLKKITTKPTEFEKIFGKRKEKEEKEKGKEIDYKEFSRHKFLIGRVVVVEEKDGKVEVTIDMGGKMLKTEIETEEKDILGRLVAILDGKVLTTEDKKVVTVDREVKPGAKVR